MSCSKITIIIIIEKNCIWFLGKFDNSLFGYRFDKKSLELVLDSHLGLKYKLIGLFIPLIILYTSNWIKLEGSNINHLFPQNSVTIFGG
jgi:hypothetical protein